MNTSEHIGSYPDHLLFVSSFVNRNVNIVYTKIIQSQFQPTSEYYDFIYSESFHPK